MKKYKINMKTRIVELIYTEDRRGEGVKDDPARMVQQLWTKDGTLVAEQDSFGKSYFLGLDYEN